MEIAVVSTPKLSATLTVDDLREVRDKAFSAGLKVYSTETDVSGAAMKWEYGPRQGEALVYMYACLRHDNRVKLTFSKPNNAHVDAIIHMSEFDKEAAFAAALRIALGDLDMRFQSKSRVATLVKKVGVYEIAKNLPPVFSDFMFAVLHVFNCKLGKDIGEQVKALRAQIKTLVPHLSEADVVRIYREEVVDFIGRL